MFFLVSICLVLIIACDKSDPQREAELLKQLRDQNAKHRIEAICKLSKLRFVSDSIVLALGSALEDKDEEIQIAAAAALNRLGPAAKRATNLLIASFSKSSGSVSSYVEDTLVQIGPPAIPGLVALLEDHKWTVRIKTACMLGRIGIGSKIAEKALVKQLKHEKRDVRFSIAEALLRINKNNREAIPILASMLKSTDEELRFRAAEALARSANGNKLAIPILVDYSYNQETDFNHLVRALLAMWRAEPYPKQCVGDLSRLLRDDRIQKEPGLRLIIAATLLKMDPQFQVARKEGLQSIRLLITLLDGKSLDQAVLAAETLGRLGSSAKDALPELRKCLKSTHSELSQAAKQAIQQIEERKLP